jgi:hypothetical protein
MTTENADENIAETLVKRITALVPNHPELLTMDNPLDFSIFST